MSSSILILYSFPAHSSTYSLDFHHHQRKGRGRDREKCFMIQQGRGSEEKQTGCVLIMRKGEGMVQQRDKT
jgi:hypothetical protein